MQSHSLYSLALKAKAERMIMDRDTLTDQEIAQLKLDLKYSSLSQATINNYLERLKIPNKSQILRSKDEK